MTPVDLPAAGSPEMRSSAELGTLLRSLEQHHAPDPQQESVRLAMIEFARTHPDALHRTCVDGHFTGSALVVEQGTGRVLLLFHTKLRRWLQPGGHTDGEATMAITALREASEETGIDGLRVLPAPIDLDIHEVRPPSEPPHLHHDVRFLVVAPAGSSPVGNHESESIRWVEVAELDEFDVDDSVIRLVERGLEAARRQPGIGID